MNYPSLAWASSFPGLRFFTYATVPNSCIPNSCILPRWGTFLCFILYEEIPLRELWGDLFFIHATCFISSSHRNLGSPEAIRRALISSAQVQLKFTFHIQRHHFEVEIMDSEFTNCSFVVLIQFYFLWQKFSPLVWMWELYSLSRVGLN